jgi:hypothetical protein
MWMPRSYCLGACRKTSGSVLAGRDRRPGRRSAARVVFVMLEMRKPPHEARAALIPDGLTRVEPRIQCVLTQWMC